MIYRRIGDSGVEISIVGLGGHEYLSDGRSRGFNDAPERATLPGVVLEGFGREHRQALIRYCYTQGINFFDATMDSEKDSVGRNLEELPPPYPVYVQTRPEGLVYGRDPYNQGMARYEVLKAEVQRGLGLLRRERLDFLNLAFMRPALEHDPDYLLKLGDNVARLKAEGLIRFACLDTFSGEWTYLQGIAAGSLDDGIFDAAFINFNLANDGALRAVFPAAQEAGMAVFVRECFMKGELFHMGDEVGLTDRGRLAQVALKWNLNQGRDAAAVTMAVVGAKDAEQMASNLRVLEDLTLNDEDRVLIERLRTSPRFQEYREQRRAQFFEE
jgi:aryl-alcohol dehydrogenase-like predicted oxidoreductase